MSILIFSGVVSLLTALILFIRFANSTNDGDMWAGIVVAWLLMIGVVLIFAAGVLWIVKNFAYVGGAA